MLIEEFICGLYFGKFVFGVVVIDLGCVEVLKVVILGVVLVLVLGVDVVVVLGVVVLYCVLRVVGLVVDLINFGLIWFFELLFLLLIKL